MSQQKKNQLTSQEQDSFDKIVAEIEKKHSPENKTMTAEEWEKEIEEKKNGKGEKRLIDKINVILAELEEERNKPPAIQIKEREVVKYNLKCEKCSQKEYDNKLKKIKSITYGALIYSIVISILQIIKNDLIKSDFKAFFEGAWCFIHTTFKNANRGIMELCKNIDNNIIQRIINIGVWVIIAGLVGYGIYKIYNELQYRTWKFWNVGAVVVLLVDLLVIVFLSETIKKLIEINLITLALFLFIAYIVIRIIRNLIKKY